MRQIGLDPKHLERRAAVLGEKEKAAYEAYVKRQEAKEAAEGGMEVDAGDVEMDEAEGSSAGARGVSARGPKTNRQLAGMATEAVRRCFLYSIAPLAYLSLCPFSKQPRPPSSESSPSENPTEWHERQSPIVISRLRGRNGCCPESESRVPTRDVERGHVLGLPFSVTLSSSLFRVARFFLLGVCDTHRQGLRAGFG